MRGDLTAWLFGKPYIWRMTDGVLTLYPDFDMRVVFPRSTARGAARSWAEVEHKFTSELPAGKSALATQADLYARLLNLD